MRTDPTEEQIAGTRLERASNGRYAHYSVPSDGTLGKTYDVRSDEQDSPEHWYCQCDGLLCPHILAVLAYQKRERDAELKEGGYEYANHANPHRLGRAV